MRSRAWVTWILVLVWWTLHGLAQAVWMRLVHDASGEPMFTWGYALEAGVAGSWIWALFTLAFLWIVRRYPLDRRPRAMSLLIHAIAVLAIVVLRPLIIVILNRWVFWYEEQDYSYNEVLLNGIWFNPLFGCIIVGVAHALLFVERAHQRERQAAELRGHLAEARLQALATQLNPHFLFNSLNSIAELLHQDPHAAERMVVHLSELLHQSLDAAGAQEIPLREELRLLRHYLDIEHVRLGTRLRLAWNVDKNTLEAFVPHLILQPLVENAIRYAVAPRITPTKVRVSARRHDGCLVLEVSDDGTGVTRPNGNCGIGLANTRARLECLYGKGNHLTLTTEPRGTTARLTIPERPHLQPEQV